MTEFMKTIVSAIKTWVKGLIKESTADWNQNDAEASNYIKNRPFYEEEAFVTIIEEQTITGFSIMQEPIYAAAIPPSFTPVFGVKYIIKWDGTSYECELAEADGLAYLGNENYVFMASGGDIPFAVIFAGEIIIFSTESTEESHSIGISYEQTVVHKLDKKYLPDGISSQPDWNQNDSAQADYIKNRPFGEFNDKILDEKWFINNDGFPEPFPSSWGNLLYSGRNYVVVLDGNEYQAQAYDDDVDGTGMTLSDTKYGQVCLYNSNYIWFSELQNKEVDIKIYETYTKTIDPKFETDPTVPDWAKKPNKPTYIADEVGAMAKENPVGTGSFSMNRKAGTTVGLNSHAEGADTTASAIASHAEGSSTYASAAYSHAEGSNTRATAQSAHAEGYLSQASGYSSHAEGEDTYASGDCSHTEGYGTSARKTASHAEGYETLASGNYQHVQGMYNNFTSPAVIYTPIEGKGDYTMPVGSKILIYYSKDGYTYDEASGTYSVKGGSYGTAYDYNSGQSKCFDIGNYITINTRSSNNMWYIESVTKSSDKYTITGTKYTTRTNAYAHIVGNGISNKARSNAHTLDWNGNAEYAGDVKANACGGAEPISLVELASTVSSQQTTIDSTLTNAKSYTDQKIDAIVGEGASTTLDTIGEIASAIEENQDMIDTLNAAIGNKVDKVSGKGLSTNDLTATLKSNYDTAYSHVSNKSNPHGITLSQLGVTATAAELNYVDGVTSNVQTQINTINNTIGDISTALANILGVGGATYSITYNLTRTTSTNTSTSIVHGSSYSTTLQANAARGTYSVKMGGVDITSSVATTSGTKGLNISIPSVTGDLIISMVDDAGGN